MNWFQNLFIENESKQSELANAAEKAASNAGFDITVKPDGRIRYNNEDSYNDQEGVASAIRTDVECAL